MRLQHQRQGKRESTIHSPGELLDCLCSSGSQDCSVGPEEASSTCGSAPLTGVGLGEAAGVQEQKMQRHGRQENRRTAAVAAWPAARAGNQSTGGARELGAAVEAHRIPDAGE